MDEPLKKITKSVLDLLPFDGDKTKIGVLGTAYGVLSPILGLPVPGDLTGWLIATVGTIVIGQVHKWLKKKFPKATLKYPSQSDSLL